MKFTFVDRKVTIPASIHEYAEKKIGKLDRYFKTEAEANVVFSIQKDQNVAEVTVRSGSTILRVNESTKDMFASIDSAVTAMERQLRRHKTRLEKRLRQDAFERTFDVSSFVPEPDEEEFKIMRTKHFPLHPMTCEEAILQMNLLAHSFFAFRDGANNDAFSVVYRRDDGGYGLIQDEN